MNLQEMLQNQYFCRGLTPQTQAFLLDCAHLELFEPGQKLVKTGSPADEFYLIHQGHVAMEVIGPQAKGLQIEILDAGDMVGWNWLVKPYRYQFDARALDQVQAIRFDARCLRGKIEVDHEFGFVLLQKIIEVMAGRISHSRLQLLDLYHRQEAP